MCGCLTWYMNILNFVIETCHPKKKLKNYKSSTYWPIMILVVTLWCLVCVFSPLLTYGERILQSVNVL